MLIKDDFSRILPQGLIENICYYNFKDDLNMMFAEFGSENFIRELC
jgi:hypothetical protein